MNVCHNDDDNDSEDGDVISASHSPVREAEQDRGSGMKAGPGRLSNSPRDKTRECRACRSDRALGGFFLTPLMLRMGRDLPTIKQGISG